MNKGKTILAVGSLAIDDLETPNGNRKNLLGGSASYFSVAAGLLAPVKLVGVVGKDYPQEGWNMFKQRGINTDNVHVQPGETFRWGGSITKTILQGLHFLPNWVFLRDLIPLFKQRIVILLWFSLAIFNQRYSLKLQSLQPVQSML